MGNNNLDMIGEVMSSRSKAWVIATVLVLYVSFGGACLIGCKTPDQTASVLEALERGQAEGHLVIVTDGQLKAELIQGVRFGAAGTVMSFDGSVNWSGAGKVD